MNKTIVEDYEFTVTVTQGGQCRMGFETGDTFACRYECPAGFCPKTMGALHTLCEVVRGGGDLRNLGGSAPREIDFTCADGVIRFHLSGRHLNLSRSL